MTYVLILYQSLVIRFLLHSADPSDILDFERIESGSMVLEQVPFSVSSELSKVENMLSRVAEQKKLTLAKMKVNIKYSEANASIDLNMNVHQ